jgi:hypothetical protein
MPLPELSTHNGNGRRLMNLRPQPDGSFFATAWTVRLNLPVRPLSRHRLRVLASKSGISPLGAGIMLSSEHRLELIEDTPLVPAEVRHTRLMAWIVTPAVLLAPLALAVVGSGWLDAFFVAQGWTQVTGGGVGLMAALLWLSLGFQVIEDRERKKLERLPRSD